MSRGIMKAWLPLLACMLLLAGCFGGKPPADGSSPSAPASGTETAELAQDGATKDNSIEQPPALPLSLELSGSIDGKYVVAMTLSIEGNDAQGSYMYTKYKQPIKLQGSAKPEGPDGGWNVEVDERDDSGAVSGHFSGTIKGAGSDVSFAGTWTNTDGSKSMPFSLSAGPPASPEEAAESPWAGEWNWKSNNQFNVQSLTVTNAGSEKFDFVLDASSGGHVGSIEGIATLSADSNSAKYTDENIEVDMRLNQGVLTIEITGDASLYGGIGVFFGGEFVQQYTTTTLDLIELGVFEKKELDDQFRELAGDGYDLFTSSLQLFSPEPDENDPSITVVQGGVRGLFTAMEAIIMYKEDGTFWAAAINSYENTVEYYTTVKEDASKLPAAIETWRSRFDQVSIVYKSA